MEKLPLYRSHKLVRAAPVLWIGGESAGKVKVMLTVKGEPLDRLEIEVDAEVFLRGRPGPGDFLVAYDGGKYVSWSPRDTFTAGYSLAPVDPPEPEAGATDGAKD